MNVRLRALGLLVEAPGLRDKVIAECYVFLILSYVGFFFFCSGGKDVVIGHALMFPVENPHENSGLNLGWR